MKKTLFIYLLCLCSCLKKEIIIKYVPAIINKTDTSVIMTRDTTINYPQIWDGAGKTISINGWRIRGNGVFQNWDIDASVNQIIFDSSITLKNIKTAKTPFSTIWYGTNPGNIDNWWNIQKSINVCTANHLECFTPGGTYKYSKTFELSTLVGNTYQQSDIHFYGDASLWDNGRGTTFQYTGLSGMGMNVQLNKGTELDHFKIFGMWKAPRGGVDSIYFNLNAFTFKDISGNNISDYYYGIAIDGRIPPNGSISGSTGIHIHEVGIGNFGMLLAMSQNGVTANDDIMRVENLHLYDGKYGIVNGQAQEKDMKFSGVYSWGNIYQVINIGHFGKSQAGAYTFDGGNIAGGAIMFADISVAHWFSTHITNFFCESLGYIGNFSAQQPITIDNCNFDMNYNFNKKRSVINSNSGYTSFEHCVIRYYDGAINNVYVHGYLTIPGPPNNYFGGGNLLYN